jgi:hypothetical protein
MTYSALGCSFPNAVALATQRGGSNPSALPVSAEGGNDPDPLALALAAIATKH